MGRGSSAALALRDGWPQRWRGRGPVGAFRPEAEEEGVEQDWTHLHDPDAKVAKLKEGGTHMAQKVIVSVISGVMVATAVLLAMPQSSQSGSYRYLSERGKELADGIAQDADDYNRRLTVSQRATFEAVVHALEQERIDGLIVSVTAVWGEEPRSTDGTRQFRLSVVLARDVESILNGKGYGLSKRGHVILPTGEVRKGDREVDSARQPGKSPKLQVSWLEADPTIGEVDIDYREFHLGFDVFRLGFGGHLEPNNSNVMAGLPGGSSHYLLHSLRYGLVRWWD